VTAAGAGPRATPAELRARLAELREAGAALRRRPARATLDALAGALDAWRDPASAWRRALEAELPAATGFSPPTVREGLARALEAWSGDALRALVDAELGGARALEGEGPTACAGFETTAVILAGAIPMPTILALLAPLVLRSPVLAKAAARDPVTPRLGARSLAEADPGLGAALAVVGFPGGDAECSAVLLEAECVAATGSDATVAELRARVPDARRVVARGHRLSLAALGPEATRGPALRRAAAALALDVALWDQLGCLSPVSVHAVDADPAACDRVAEALAAELAAAEERWPRGRVDAATASAIGAERDEAELRGAAGRRVAVLASRGTAWTVVREDAPELRPGPLHRFVRVHPAHSPERLRAALAPAGRHLAAVAVEGFGPQTRGIARALAELGASRVCAPGTLQAPPLAWHCEGAGVLAPFARFTDLEAAG
jgi:hypothetical protein